MAKDKIARRKAIKKGIRRKLSGTSERPRLSVFRSNRFMYTQLIDDTTSKTLLSASTAHIDKEASLTAEMAAKLGELTAQKALGAGIKKVVFDRNGYLYHGRIKALADKARETGLEF